MFNVQIVGADVIVTGPATWFGGPADKMDNGDTASGVENKKMGVLGCSLPFPVSNGRIVPNCIGSPLPPFPWGTLVEVSTDDAHKITVPLIDVGPEVSTGHAIDLTPTTFLKVGGDLSHGVIIAHARIIGGAKFFPAKAV